MLNLKKLSRITMVIVVGITAVLGLWFSVNRKNTLSSELTASPSIVPGVNDKISIKDIIALSKKGDDLLFENFALFRGVDASSTVTYKLMIYGVEGGYRLIVRPRGTGKPDFVNLESTWEDNGSGIDIRYNDVEEFIKNNPSVVAITDEEARGIAETALGVELERVNWSILADYERREEENAVYAEALIRSLTSLSYAIDEPSWLFHVKGTKEWGGTYYAVGKKSGVITPLEPEEYY